jgi:hypothetical protein
MSKRVPTLAAGAVAILVAAAVAVASFKVVGTVDEG